MMAADKKIKKVLVTAGGTGGHVFPALAAAKLFESRGIQVCWIGTEQGIESRIVPQNHIYIEYLDISGVRGQGFIRLLWAPLKIAKSVLRVMAIIRRFQPDLILGMGGFVSGPTGLAGWLSGRPVFIHEQNAIAGFTNKMLSKIAKRVFQAFPGAFPDGNKVETTGNPVRSEIVAVEPPANRYSQRQGAIRVLILGGSQGAVALNEIVPKALAHLISSIDFEILHQAGNKNSDTAIACYESAGVNAKVVPFIEDMAAAYAWADLVICRSGALTVCELAAVGVAALLIPYPFAVDDHQTANARYLSEAGAAILVQQSDLDEAQLAKMIKTDLSDRAELQAMAEKGRKLAMTHATELLVERCEEVALGR